MLWQYLGILLSFAFRRTTIAIDSLQIVTASAIPALAKVVGFEMAPNLATDTLAYIGAAGVVWIVLRLICAPYFIWRDQVGEIGALKLELSKPELLEFRRMSKIRARKRVKLAATLHQMHTSAYLSDANDAELKVGQKYLESLEILAACGLGHIGNEAVDALHNVCTSITRSGDKEAPEGDFHLLWNITEFLHGRITGEALALQLPRDTAQEGRR